jgi:hypothetical protein
MPHIEYVAGVCNIGPKEIARRRNLGWIALLISIVVLALLIWSGINSWWRLLLFFPVTLSASGFLQAYFHFCSGYARRGMFNFGPPGQHQAVSDEASKAKDKKKGNQITHYAVIIGVAVAVIAVFL